MPAFIHVPCPCGHEVRAGRDQAGGSVRCWSCGREVAVPLRTAGRLAAACVEAVLDALRPSAFGPVVAGALALVAALLVPKVGAWLGFAVLVAGAWFYQGLLRNPGAPRHASWNRAPFSANGEAVDDGESAAWTDLAVRSALAIPAAAALVAPFLIRNGGKLLPGEPSGVGPFAGMLAALAAWAVAPLLLLAANARERPAWRAVARHPVAVAASLALFPCGLLLLEGFTAALCLEQGILAPAVSDLFPTPEIGPLANGSEVVFNFDGATRRFPFELDVRRLLGVYLAGLGRGHTLVADFPLSLATGWQVSRFDPVLFRMTWEAFFAYRCVFSALVLTGAGLLLSVQARWLGLTAAVDALVAPHRPKPGAFPTGNGRPVAAAPALIAADEPPASSAPLDPPPVAASWGVAPSAEGAGSGTILVIDDERAFAHALGRILVGRGFTVHLAADAAEGLRLARTARPDLIVLDLLLPDRPGMDLCRDLRDDPLTREIPILIATYKAGADDEVAALSHGADDYIAKPYVVEVLIARIQTQLRRRAR